ncbi:MAG: hypothetical protein ABF946_03690 [Acetobacter papayae]
MGIPQLADLVLETANAPGTGSFTLGGAPAGRQTFADAFPAGGEVFYYASDGTQTEWGIGTLTVGSPNILARTTVIGNLFGSKSALNFSSEVTIWNEVPAARTPLQDDAGLLPVSANPDFARDVALSAKAAESRYASRAGSNTFSGNNSFSGSNTYSGSNAFSQNPTVPTPAAGDSSTKAANTAFVGTAVAAETAARVAADASNAKLSGGNALNGDQQVVGNLRVWNSANAGETLISTGSGISWIEHLSTRGGAVDAYIALEPSVIATHLGNMAVTSQLPFSDTNMRIQAFTVTGTGETTVPFPTAFRAGTVPIVSLTINREAGNTSRFPNLNNSSATNNPAITNTGFTFQPVFVSGANSNSSGQPWTLQVIAMGYF